MAGRRNVSTARLTRSDADQPVTPGITTSCSSVNILSICSGLVQAEQTPTTSDVVEKTIIAPTHNGPELPICYNISLFAKLF